MQSVEYLDANEIKSVLCEKSKALLCQLDIFESIDSTNTHLLKVARSTHGLGHVCLAEEQTAGRGRQGKTWFSPKASNIYCSLLWRFPHGLKEISHLSLAVSVILIKALKRYGIEDTFQLKWPNDIYYGNRKLAGVLIEAIPTQQLDYPVVIGIGLNLALPENHDLMTPSIGLSELVGRAVARNYIAGLIIDELLLQLPHYVEHGFYAFLPEWSKYDMLLGQAILIRSPQQEFFGYAEGVNAAGELILRDENGVSRSFRCGEVSVRLG